MSLGSISNILEKNFFNIFLVCYISFAIFPSFKALDFYNYIMIGLLFLFTYSYFFINNNWLSSISRYTFLSIFTIIILFALAYGSRNVSTGLGYFIYIHIIFCFSVLKNIYESDISQKQIKNIVVSSFLVFSLVTLITLNALFYDPYASRLAKVDEPNGVLLAMQGIGGYNFIYSLSLLLVSTIPFLYKLNIFGKSSKIFLLFFVVVAFITIVASNFFTALFITLFGIWFFYFQHRPFLMLFAALILIISMLIILQLLSNFFGTENMNLIKLIEIISLFGGDEFGSYSYGRIERYIEALYGITEYPLFGMMNQGLNVIEVYGYSQHSAFLDIIALYGIFIGLGAFIIFLVPLFTLKLKFSLLKRGYNSCIAMYLIVLALNINTIDIMVTMFLIVPVFFKYMDNLFQISDEK